MSSAAIRAGRAFVELFSEDSKLRRGLKGAEAFCKNWGARVTKIGGAIFAAGSVALGGLGALTAQAAGIGGMFIDLSAKSGAAVESLSLLKYAAEQNGGSLESVAGGIKILQKNLVAARGGLKEMIGAFTKLGTSAEELSKLSPDEQFLRMADAIAKIPDPADRTAMAMKVFGKSGADLLPVLSQGSERLREFMDTARKMGLQISTEEAQALDDFGDAWATVKEQAIRAGIGIAASLAPTLTDLSAKISEQAVQLIDWITKNQDTVVSIAEMVVQVTAAGAAILVFGQAISTVGTIIAGFNTALKFTAAHAAGLQVALAGIAAATITIGILRHADAVQELNRELENSIELNNELLGKQRERNSAAIDEAKGIADPAERRKALEGHRKSAQDTTAALEGRIQSMQAQLDSDSRAKKALSGFAGWFGIKGERDVTQQAIDDLKEQQAAARKTAEDATREINRLTRDAVVMPTDLPTPKPEKHDKSLALPGLPPGLEYKPAGPMGPAMPDDSKWKAQFDRVQRARDAAKKATEDAKKASEKKTVVTSFEKPEKKEQKKPGESLLGTFSSHRLESLGASGGAMDRTANNTARLVQLAEQQERNALRIFRDRIAANQSGVESRKPGKTGKTGLGSDADIAIAAEKEEMNKQNQILRRQETLQRDTLEAIRTLARPGSDTWGYEKT